MRIPILSLGNYTPAISDLADNITRTSTHSAESGDGLVLFFGQYISPKFIQNIRLFLLPFLNMSTMGAIIENEIIIVRTLVRDSISSKPSVADVLAIEMLLLSISMDDIEFIPLLSPIIIDMFVMSNPIS